MSEITFSPKDEASMIHLGKLLLPILHADLIIYLIGDLGAGKTTLVRSLLKAAGVTGAIKSPTYTLIETYPLMRFPIHHADLYRLGDPEELEYIGIRDYLEGNACLLVEWPEKGQGVLPEADIQIEIAYANEGRNISIKTNSAKGSTALDCLSC